MSMDQSACAFSEDDESVQLDTLSGPDQRQGAGALAIVRPGNTCCAARSAALLRLPTLVCMSHKFSLAKP